MASLTTRVNYDDDDDDDDDDNGLCGCPGCFLGVGRTQKFETKTYTRPQKKKKNAKKLNPVIHEFQEGCARERRDHNLGDRYLARIPSGRYLPKAALLPCRL